MIIYDNNGKTWDRYTIIPNDKVLPGQVTECLGLSDNCNEPRGYSQWGVCQLGEHLGKRIKFSQLPKEVREHARKRLKEE